MNSLKEFETAVLVTGVKRIDTVNGRKHYISVSEEGRAMVGPQAKRRRGWKWPVRKRKNEAVRNLYQDGEALNPALVRVVKEETNILAGVPRMNIRLTFPPPPPQPKRGWFSRKWEWWLDRFYSEEWHKALRHTALDIVMWSIAVFTALLLVKGALWLISL